MVLRFTIWIPSGLSRTLFRFRTLNFGASASASVCSSKRSIMLAAFEDKCFTYGTMDAKRATSRAPSFYFLGVWH